MNHEKIAIIDFDGTLCTHEFPEIGTIEPDVREALLKLKELGYQIHIHSCRTATYWDRSGTKYSREQHIALMHNFMEDNDLPYDKVAYVAKHLRPMADILITVNMAMINAANFVSKKQQE